MIRGIVVDTSYFRGNYPEHCSLDACAIEGHTSLDDLTNDSIQWIPIMAQLPLAGDTQNPFPIQNDQRLTHLRFNIYPDGGVARLRVYGEVLPDWTRLKRLGGDIDLAAVENGGLVLACSDMFSATGTI
jgi:allantoicase